MRKYIVTVYGHDEHTNRMFERIAVEWYGFMHTNLSTIDQYINTTLPRLLINGTCHSITGNILNDYISKYTDVVDDDNCSAVWYTIYVYPQCISSGQVEVHTRLVPGADQLPESINAILVHEVDRDLDGSAFECTVRACLDTLLTCTSDARV